MKKLLSVILLLCLLCGAVSAAGAAGSNFDVWAKDPVTISNPVFPQPLTARELEGNNDQIVQFIARAWYNMLAYETDVLGTDIKKTKAADIYRGIKKGPGISVFASPGPDSEYVSALFAFSDRFFWIECNTNTQAYRYFEWKYPIDKQKKDEGYLSEYTVNSMIAAALGTNSLMGGYAGTISEAYGTKTQIWKVFNAAYRTARGSENPIK